MKNKTGISILVICILLVLTVSFSVLSVFHGSGHNCCVDDNCRICAVVQSLIDTIGAGVVALLVSFFAFSCTELLIKRSSETELLEHNSSPVLLKVKLLD